MANGLDKSSDINKGIQQWLSDHGFTDRQIDGTVPRPIPQADAKAGNGDGGKNGKVSEGERYALFFNWFNLYQESLKKEPEKDPFRVAGFDLDLSWIVVDDKAKGAFHVTPKFLEDVRKNLLGPDGKGGVLEDTAKQTKLKQAMGDRDRGLEFIRCVYQNSEFALLPFNEQNRVLDDYFAKFGDRNLDAENMKRLVKEEAARLRHGVTVERIVVHYIILQGVKTEELSRHVVKQASEQAKMADEMYMDLDTADRYRKDEPARKKNAAELIDKAARYYELALTFNSYHPFAHQKLAAYYLEKKGARSKEFHSHFVAALKNDSTESGLLALVALAGKDPSVKDAWAEVAKALARERRFGESAFIYRKAAEALPAGAARYLKLAAKAEQLDTGHARYWQDLGDLYLKQRNPAKAAKAYETGAKLEPQNELIMQRLGEAEYASRTLAKPYAFLHIEQVETIVEAKIQKAQELAKAGKSEKARAAFFEAGKSFEDLCSYGDKILHTTDYSAKTNRYQQQLIELGYQVYFQNRELPAVYMDLDKQIEHVDQLLAKGKLKEARQAFQVAERDSDNVRIYGAYRIQSKEFDQKTTEFRKKISGLQFKLHFGGKAVAEALADLGGKHEKIEALIAKGKFSEAEKLLTEAQADRRYIKDMSGDLAKPKGFKESIAQTGEILEQLEFKIHFKGQSLPDAVADLGSKTEQVAALFESGELEKAEAILAKADQQLAGIDRFAPPISQKPADFTPHLLTLRASLRFYRTRIKEERISAENLSGDYQKCLQELGDALPKFQPSPYGKKPEVSLVPAYVMRARVNDHLRNYQAALKDYEAALLNSGDPKAKNAVLLEANLFFQRVEESIQFFDAQRADLAKSKDMSNALMVQILDEEIKLKKVLVGKWGDGNMYGFYDKSWGSSKILPEYQKAVDAVKTLETERKKYLEAKGEDIVLVQAQAMVDQGYLKTIPDVASLNGKKLGDFVKLVPSESNPRLASAAPMGEIALPGSLEMADAVPAKLGDSGLRLDLSSADYKNLPYADKVLVLQQLAGVGMAAQNGQLRDQELKIAEVEQKKLDESGATLGDADKSKLHDSIDRRKLRAKYYDWRSDFLQGKPQQAQLKMREFKADFLALAGKDPIAGKDFEAAKANLFKKDSELEMMFLENQGMLRTFTRSALNYLQNQDAMITETRKGSSIFKTRLNAADYGKLAKKLIEYMEQGRGDTFEELIAAMQADHNRIVEEFLKIPVKKGEVVNLSDYDHKGSRGDRDYEERHKAINGFLGRFKNDPNASDPAVPTVHLDGGIAVWPPDWGGVIQMDGAQKIVIGRKGGMIKTGAMTQPWVFPPLKEGEPDRDRVVVMFRGEPWFTHVEYGKDYEQKRSAMWDINADVERAKMLSYRTSHNEVHAHFFGTENLWANISRQDPSFKVFYDLNTKVGLEMTADPAKSREYILQMGKTLRGDGSYDISGQTLRPIFEKPLEKVIATQISDARKQEIRTEVTKERDAIMIKKKEELKEWESKHPDQYAHFSADGPPTSDEWNALLEKSIQAEIDNRVNVKLAREGLAILDNWTNTDADQFAKKQQYLKDGLTDPFAGDALALDAFKSFEDMLNPLDKHWYQNMSDREWDAVDDFLFVTAVTLPMTMGVGSVAGSIVRGTALYAELAAEGSWILADVVLVGGASAIGMGTAQTFLNVPFGGKLSFEAFAMNILTGWAFHGGGAAWGKFARVIGIGDEAIASAIQNGQYLKGYAMKAGNAMGMLTTQAHLGMAFEYAAELGTGHDSGNYLERLGKQAGQQIFFHGAAKAFHASTGNFFLEIEGRGTVRGKIAKIKYDQEILNGKMPDEAMNLALAEANQRVPSIWSGKDPGKIYQGYIYKNAADLVEKWGIDPISPEGKALARFFMSRLATPEKLGEFKARLKEQKPRNLEEFFQKVLEIDPNSKTGKGMRAVFARALVMNRGESQLAKDFPEFFKWTAELEAPIRELLKKSGVGERGTNFKLMEAAILEAALRGGIKPEQIRALAAQAESLPTILESLMGAKLDKLPKGVQTRLTQEVLLWALNRSENFEGTGKTIDRLAELAHQISPLLDAAMNPYLKDAPQKADFAPWVRTILLSRILSSSKTADAALERAQEFSLKLGEAAVSLRAALDLTLGLEPGKNEMPELMAHFLMRSLAAGSDPQEIVAQLELYSRSMVQFQASLGKLVDQAFAQPGGKPGSQTPFGRQVMAYLLFGALASGKSAKEIETYLDNLTKLAPELGKTLLAGESALGKLVENGGGEGKRLLAQLLLKALSSTPDAKQAIEQLNQLIGKSSELEATLKAAMRKVSDEPLKPAAEKQVIEQKIMEALGSAKTLEEIPAKLKEILDHWLEGDHRKAFELDPQKLKKSLGDLGLTEADARRNPALIKSKYRELARQFHTDLGAKDKGRIEDINIAYNYLEGWRETLSKDQADAADSSPPKPKPAARPAARIPLALGAGETTPLTLDQIQQQVLSLNGLGRAESGKVLETVVTEGSKDPSNFQQALTILTGLAKTADAPHFNRVSQSLQILVGPLGKAGPLSFAQQRAQVLQSLGELAMNPTPSSPEHFRQILNIATEAGLGKAEIGDLTKKLLANPAFSAVYDDITTIERVPEVKPSVKPPVTDPTVSGRKPKAVDTKTIDPFEKTEVEAAARGRLGRAQLPQTKPVETPTTDERLAKQAQQATELYSVTAGVNDPLSHDRILLDHLAGSPIKLGHLAKLAKAAQLVLPAIHDLRQKIQELDGKIKALPEGDPQADTLKQSIKKNEAELRKHIETVDAYEYAKIQSELVRDRALASYIYIQESVEYPLSPTVTSDSPLAPLKSKIFSIEEMHPDSVELFSQYNAAFRQLAGGLTFVVGESADITVLANAIAETTFRTSTTTKPSAPRLLLDQSRLKPDRNGEAKLVYEADGPNDTKLQFEIKVRAANQEEKARRTKHATANVPTPIVHHGRQAGDPIEWEMIDGQPNWRGRAENLPGIEFENQGGKLWARSTAEPQKILINGKDFLELGQKFQEVIQREGDTVEIQGTVYQSLGAETRLVPIYQPEKFGVQSAAPVAKVLGPDAVTAMRKALPKGAHAVEVSFKIDDMQHSADLAGALKAQVPDAWQTQPDTYVILHLERAQDDGSIRHFVLVDTYEQIAGNQLPWVAIGQKQGTNFHLDYIVQPAKSGGLPSIHLGKIVLSPEWQSQGLGQQAFSALMQSLGRDYPGATVNAHAVNPIVVYLFGKYLDKAKGVTIQDMMANTLDGRLEPGLIEALHRITLLSADELAEFQKLQEAKPAPGELSPQYRMHNRFWEIIERHRQEAVAAGTSQAASSAQYFFETLKGHPEIFAELKKLNYWGDLWVEGTLPAQSKASDTIALDERDMLDVVQRLNVVNLAALAPPIPEETTIYLPKDHEQLTDVYPIHDLNDPAVWNAVYVEEITAPVKPPPPPAEAFAGERRKCLLSIVREFDLAIDKDYFDRLEKAAAESQFNPAEARKLLAILQPAFQGMDPFISEISRRELFFSVVAGKLNEAGAIRFRDMFLAGEIKPGFRGNQFGLQLINSAGARHEAKLKAGIWSLFRETKAPFFSPEHESFEALKEALIGDQISLKQLEVLAGKGLPQDQIASLEAIWGPRSTWLPKAGQILMNKGPAALKEILNEAAATHEIVALAATATPFAALAKRDLAMLGSLSLGSPGYQKIIASYESERNKIAQAIIDGHAKPMHRVEAFLAKIGKKTHVVKVEARLKKASDIGAKAVRRGLSTLDAITDFAGTRIIVKGPEDVMAVVRAIGNEFKVRDTHEKDGAIQLDVSHTEKNERGEEVLVLDSVPDHDAISRMIHGTKTGYRAVHIVVMIDGKPVEIQIQTEAMARWGKIQHQAGYKNDALDILTKDKIDRYFKAAGDYLSAIEREQQGVAKPEVPKILGLPTETRNALNDMNLLLEEYGSGGKLSSLDAKRMARDKAPPAQPLGDIPYQAAAQGRSPKVPQPTTTSGGFQGLLRRAKDFISRIRFRQGLGMIVGGEFYLAPRNDPAVREVFGDMITGSTTSLFMAVGHYDMIAADFSVQGSYTLDSSDLKIPGEPWQVRVDYEKGPNDEVFAKIVPLQGRVEIQNARTLQYSPIPEAGMVLKQDMLRLRLGGREWDYGTPQEANSYRHEYYRQRIDINAFLASFSEEGKSRFEKVANHPENWGHNRSEQAKAFWSQLEALKSQYDGYLKRLDDPKTDRQALAEDWTKLQIAFSALKATEFFRWYHGMELDYVKVLQQVEGDLWNFQEFLLNQQIQGTKDQRSALFELVYPTPESLGQDRIQEFPTLENRGLSGISVKLEIADDDQIPDILKRLTAAGYHHSPYNKKTHQVSVKVEGQGYSYFVKVEFKRPGVAMPEAEPVPAAESFDAAAAGRSGQKQNPIQAPAQPEGLPEVLKRIAKSDALQAGESERLIETILAAKTSPDNKAAVLLRLARRSDFKSFPKVTHAILHLGLEATVTEKALNEIAALSEKAKKPAPQMVMGAFSGGALMFGDPSFTDQLANHAPVLMGFGAALVFGLGFWAYRKFFGGAVEPSLVAEPIEAPAPVLAPPQPPVVTGPQASVRISADGSYTLGSGRKGDEGSYYLKLPDRVLSQRAALITKQGDALSLMNHPDSAPGLVWVQDLPAGGAPIDMKKNWGRVQPGEEYPLQPLQPFALGEVRVDWDGNANFDGAVILTLGEDGGIYSARELLDAAPTTAMPATVIDQAPTWMEYDADGRPQATHQLKNPKMLHGGSYQASAINLEVPVAPLIASGYPQHIKIMTGDGEKLPAKLKNDGSARLVISDYATSGTPRDWAELTIKNGEWAFKLSSGKTTRLHHGDSIQIGGIDYRIDGEYGKLVPVAADFSGKIKATLIVPFEEAVEAAAQNDRAGRIKQTAKPTTEKPR